jgi:hypothetical protein
MQNQKFLEERLLITPLALYQLTTLMQSSQPDVGWHWHGI